jgi:multidrug efflux pump
MVNFFINRPIFAWVIAIVIMMMGALAIHTLPIAQYPAIAPPAVSISGFYPGASAKTVEDTVVQPIEQQMSGLDHLLYFSSESNKDGSLTITLTFDQGTNADIAQVQVQNKLSLAMPALPQSVQAQGLRIAKSTKNFLMVIAFYSTDGRLDNNDIADYIASHVQDPISRTAGVGDYQLFGAQYAMRVWLNPARLNSFKVTTTDVANAIRSQNAQVVSGELGGLPAVPGHQINATIIGPSLLNTPEQFGKILIRVNPDGSQVRLSDVARITYGGETFAINGKFNGQPASGLAIKLASGANALDTERGVRATIDRLKPFFPPGLDIAYPYDVAPFVKISIEEVMITLFEAIVLVFLVMYLFLQNLRATLIPTIAVPVVLLGTFAILSAAGFTINTLTMFGLVLAIGLLVDDAIVVIENVERLMAEERLSPLEATRKSMKQITGALVGIALVLSAVFLPMAFFGGSTGVIYRQFSITIVSAMGLSLLVALIFTPSLCATMLEPYDHQHAPHQNRFFGWFNRFFQRSNGKYERGVAGAIRHKGRYFIIYAVVVILLGLLFMRIPTSFLPDEDQGLFFCQVTTPVGATLDRTQKVLDEMRNYLLTDEKDSVQAVFTVAGFSFAGRGQNSGIAFVLLKDWSERGGGKNGVQAVAGRAMGRFMQIKDALAFAFAPPAVLEMGNATGFDVELTDLGNVGHDALLAARNQFLGMASQDHDLMGVRPNGLEDEPQYDLHVDWERAGALGVAPAMINQTLTDAWGSSYINQFIDRGRVKKVVIQGEESSRMQPEDFSKWYVKNAAGGMVPFSAFSHGTWGFGPPKLTRYNGASAIEILGAPAPGKSTGEAMNKVAAIMSKLPKGVGYEWTGLSYEEKRAGKQTIALYAISLLVVFLCLAALYESWSIPFAVMLVVPLGIFGVILFAWLRGLSNDVFFQVGLLTTVGLAAKNAILIVEFAKENADRGMDLIEGTVQAARQRLRPILMTSLALILGVMPLAISSGAGAGGRRAIGTGVVGGMMAATALGIFFVPVFFVTVRSWVLRRAQRKQAHQGGQR